MIRRDFMKTAAAVAMGAGLPAVAGHAVDTKGVLLRVSIPEDVMWQTGHPIRHQARIILSAVIAANWPAHQRIEILDCGKQMEWRNSDGMLRHRIAWVTCILAGEGAATHATCTVEQYIRYLQDTIRGKTNGDTHD